jgi:hypothetical protein
MISRSVRYKARTLLAPAMGLELLQLANTATASICASQAHHFSRRVSPC